MQLLQTSDLARIEHSVEWAPLHLLRIDEVAGSNLSPETDHAQCCYIPQYLQASSGTIIHSFFPPNLSQSMLTVISLNGIQSELMDKIVK
jgi:hypothetical protein